MATSFTLTCKHLLVVVLSLTAVFPLINPPPFKLVIETMSTRSCKHSNGYTVIHKLASETRKKKKWLLVHISEPCLDLTHSCVYCRVFSAVSRAAGGYCRSFGQLLVAGLQAEGSPPVCCGSWRRLPSCHSRRTAQQSGTHRTLITASDTDPVHNLIFYVTFPLSVFFTRLNIPVFVN